MKKISLFISIIIFFLGIGASVFFYEEAYITSILRYPDKDIFTEYPNGPIVQGSKVRGEFKALHDNLATIKFRINVFNRINTTHIIFKLREKGLLNWSIMNTYATDRFADGLLFPFGFPVISDSKGKIYEFEIESTDGQIDNGIGIDHGYHSVAMLYVFQKDDILRDSQTIKIFLIEKIRSILFDPHAVLYTTIFIVHPLTYALKMMISSRKYFRVIILGCTVCMCIMFAYLPVSMHSNIGLWIWCVCLYTIYSLKIPTTYIFIFSLFWLFQIPVSIASGNILVSSRIAILTFILIITGVMMSVRELGKRHYD